MMQPREPEAPAARFVRAYLGLTLALSWGGLAAAIGILWRLSHDGQQVHLEAEAVGAGAGALAVVTLAGLAVGRRAARAIAAGRDHPLAAGVVGALAVYGALVVSVCALAVAVAVAAGLPPAGRRSPVHVLLGEIAFFFFCAAYGIPPALLFGAVHGLLAMPLRRLLVARRPHGAPPRPPPQAR